MRKVVSVIALVLLTAGSVFYYFQYHFVFGEGVKAGELNFFVRKGYLFKTYEGRLIQTGYRSKAPGAIESNEFNFSVRDQHVAQTLTSNSGALVELYYKEYLGTLPWRGMSRYIVDSVVVVHANR